MVAETLKVVLSVVIIFVELKIPNVDLSARRYVAYCGQQIINLLVLPVPSLPVLLK
jgi:hypothetical protein